MLSCAREGTPGNGIVFSTLPEESVTAASNVGPTPARRRHTVVPPAV